MAKRALVFGSGGFVGGYLARELKDHGYEIFGSDRATISKGELLDGYMPGDVTCSSDVERACFEFEPNIIINLAAMSSVGLSWKAPQATVQVNVNGTLNILDAAKSLREIPKILLIGSSEEYSPSSMPLKETDLTDATNPYGISKVVQERFAEVYAYRYGLKIYRTRSFNHTGIGQADTFVLPSWCKQVAEIEKSGRPGTLKVGNLEISRDFCDVRDVISAYRLLVESDYSDEVFNIGSGRSIKLSNLVCNVASFADQDISVDIDVGLLRPNDNPYICCNRSKAQEKLSWEPRIPIEKTLREMYLNFLDGDR